VAAGITFPAAVVSELELNEYVMQRVYEHGTLVGVRPPVTTSAPHPHRSHRQPTAAHLAITADLPGLG
jgi:hypothetical protein